MLVDIPSWSYIKFSVEMKIYFWDSLFLSNRPICLFLCPYNVDLSTVTFKGSGSWEKKSSCFSSKFLSVTLSCFLFQMNFKVISANFQSKDNSVNNSIEITLTLYNNVGGLIFIILRLPTP